jgi:hypothetical protein
VPPRRRDAGLAVAVKRISARWVRSRTADRLVAQLAASVLFALVLLLGASTAFAAGDQRAEAASFVQRETGARVLAMEPVVVDARAAWRVKLLTRRGDVKVLLLDAETLRPF